MYRSRTLLTISILFSSLLLLWGGSRFASAESPQLTTARMMEPEFATITGTHNNLSNPTWGATHTQLRRLLPPAYANGLSEPRGGGIDTTLVLPSTRDISNIVATQSTSMPNSLGVSDMFWQMFQFLDHDLDLTEGASPAEPFNIPVDPGTDPLLPGDISLSRSVYDTATGTTDARQQINEITTWIDASNVYGSDLQRALWKRADLPGGIKSALLITSTGNLLPIEAGTSPSGQPVQLFGAGDIRASEQSGLTAIHTLWMREHNRLVGRLRIENPTYTEEQLYQRARALVSAEMQIIIYNEMLPILLGSSAIPAYSGYDDSIDPSISNAFSTAAFRFGHTMLSPQLRRLDRAGNTLPNGDIALRDAFFNITWIQADGIDPILRGLMTQPAQELDAFIIDDVRSFLFAPFPGSPGSDLAALNMQRGREHGLPSYNATRAALGLSPATTFADITSDTDLQTKLSTAYGGDINAVDLWIAGLAEDKVAGAMVGETFHAILLDQFVRLRNGDRFWHANRDWTTYGFAADPLLDDTTALSSVRLADIIAWNTDITPASADIFFAGNVWGGTGRFYRSAQTLGNNMTAEALTVVSADFDNDGDPDIAASFYNEGVRIYRNDDGIFVDTNQTLGSQSGHALEVADFNQDGFDDLLVGNWSTQSNHLYLNNAGTFTLGQTVGSGGQSLAVGDLNGDSLLDIVLGKNGGGGTQNEIWLASGDGSTFTTPTLFGALDETIDVELAQLNADQHLDLVVGNTSGQPDRVYFGQGDGTLTDSGQSLSTNRTNSLALSDLNGDGYVDIYAGSDSADSIYYGSASGTFTDSGQSIGSWNTRAVALGDVDGNGSLDVFAASQGSGVFNRVILNAGSGALTVTGQLLGSVQTKSVDFVDLDADGDLDAVTGNSVGTGILLWINDQTCSLDRLCNFGFEAGDTRHWYDSDIADNTVSADGYNSTYAGHSIQSSSAGSSISWRGFQQALQVEEGETYGFAAWFKAENVAGLHARVFWLAADGSTITSNTLFNGVNGTFDWTQYSAQATAPAGAQHANLVIWHGADSGANVPGSTVFVDDVHFTTIVGCAGVTTIPLHECEALATLYTQTNGDGWTDNSNWLVDEDPCTWFGVTCSSGNVTTLSLVNNNLIGTLPDELGALSEIQVLSIPNNQLSGQIPHTFGQLSKLLVLYAYDNQLSGTVPAELANLDALIEFNVFANNLSGTFPNAILGMTNLQRLALHHNQFYGSVPPELGNLTQLQLISLTNNNFSGELPDTLGGLTQLTELAVDFNDFSGNLPDEFTQLGLTLLHINNTRLCVPDTAEFEQWVNQIGNFQGSGVMCHVPLQGLYILAFDAEPTSPGNLSAYFQQTLMHLTSATAQNVGTRAIVLADLDGIGDTALYVIENGSVELIRGLPNESGVLDTTLRELNTADGEQLGRVIKYVRDTYPASKEVLTFIGHGNALTPEADYATLFNPASSRSMNDPLPILPTYLEIDPTVTDAHTGDASKPFDLLSTYDVRQALEIGTDNGANPFDVVDLVHCFAATVEELFETSNPDGEPFTEMIVASPLYAYFASMMPGEALAVLDVNDDAETLATTIMTTYQNIVDTADLIDSSPDVDHPGIITVVDADNLGRLKDAIDSLAANLITEFEFDSDGTRQKLRDAYLNAGVYFDSNFCAPQAFELGAPDAVVDIGTFMNALQNEFSGSGSFNVTLATFAVKSAVSIGSPHAAVVNHTVRSGTPWFAGDLNPIWSLDQPDVAGLGLYADLGGMIKDGRTIVSWHYPFYIDKSAETGLQFVKNGTHPSWADVLTTYWEGTDLNTMACLPELPPTRSVGEIAVVDVRMAQGALRVNQPAEVSIAVRADTMIEQSLLEVIILHNETGLPVYTDTVSTGYLVTGTHEIVMSLPFTPTVEGNYTIEPFIDVDNRVMEVNEADNQLTESIAKRLVVHDNSGLTLDVQTVNGQEWFTSRNIDLELTSALDGTPTNVQYLVCSIFELAAGTNATTRHFEHTHTVTASDPTQPNYTLILPNSVQAGRIEVQCRAIAAGLFTGRPSHIAFNLAPSASTVANSQDHFIFTNDTSMDLLTIDVSAQNDSVTVTVWEPLNPFNGHQLTVNAGQNGQFSFAESYAGDYIVVVEGAGAYTLSAQRDGIPARQARSVVSPTLIQQLRPTFIAPLPSTEVLPLLEIMNVDEDGILDGSIEVQIKAQSIPAMGSIGLYLDDMHIGDATPMRDTLGMYVVTVDTARLPQGRQQLVARVMQSETTMIETYRNVCIGRCQPTAITLYRNTATIAPTPLPIGMVLLILLTLVVWRWHKRVI